MSAPADLTDDERDFLQGLGGSWVELLSRLGNPPAGPVAEAAAAADDVVRVLTDRYPNRGERLVVFARLAAALRAATDGTITELLEGRYQWVEAEPGDWRALAWQPYEVRWLAKASGLSEQTIRARVRSVVRRTLAEAKAKAAQS